MKNSSRNVRPRSQGAGRFPWLTTRKCAKFGVALFVLGSVFLTACNDDSGKKKTTTPTQTPPVTPAPVDPVPPVVNKPRDPSLPKLDQKVVWDSTPYDFRIDQQTVFRAAAVSDNAEGYFPTCVPQMKVTVLEGKVNPKISTLDYGLHSPEPGKVLLTAYCPADAIFKEASLDATIEITGLAPGSFQLSAFDEPVVPKWYDKPEDASQNPIVITNPSYTAYSAIESTPKLDNGNDIFRYSLGFIDNKNFPRTYQRYDSYNKAEDATYFTVVIKNLAAPTPKYLAVRMKQIKPQAIGGTYQVKNMDDLLKMRWDSKGTYNLTRSFLMMPNSEYASTIPGFETAGWLQIFENSAPFQGTLNGNGFTLFGFWAYRSVTPEVSLLGHLDGARVANLNFLSNKAGVYGTTNVGTVATIAKNSVFENIVVRDLSSGIVASKGSAGGIVSVIENTDPNMLSLKNVQFFGAVKGNNQVGGIVGKMKGSGESLVSRGTVTGINYVGGIVGELEGNLSKVVSLAAISDVWSTGNKLGGIAGMAKGKISQAYAGGSLNSNAFDVGGLVGNFTGSTTQTIEDSYSSMAAPIAKTNVGGLIGKINPASTAFVIKRSFVTQWGKDRSTAIVGLLPSQVSFQGVFYPDSVKHGGPDITGVGPIGKDKASADANFNQAGYLTSGAWQFDASFNWPVLKNAPVKVNAEAIK